MSKRESYEPGTFSWVDLGTTDREAAKGFYGQLFGWEGEDNPMPDGSGSVYSMMTVGGETVAAIFDQQQEQRDVGIPPAWFSYVTVAGADDAAARAKEAGGAVHAGPFDVGEAGRMAVVADPTGAMFGVWEAGDSIGATLVNDPGSLTWNELSTTDVARAGEFYESLFGWRVEPIDTGDFPPYWSIRHDGGSGGRNGGIRELPKEHQDEGVPSHWMPYFTVSSVADALATAAGAGGANLFGPLDLPQGRFAVIRDPQGAILGIFEGEVDD
jgi:predicted enzyme related to lactoylglutathione lyase